jgi:hypothetical protein
MKGRIKITPKDVQERWMVLHMKRKAESLKTLEELRMDRVAVSVNKMEDPRNALTLNEIIDSLPSQRKSNDFLNISEQDILKSSYIDSEGQKH